MTDEQFKKFHALSRLTHALQLEAWLVFGKCYFDFLMRSLTYHLHISNESFALEELTKLKLHARPWSHADRTTCMLCIA
jgi:hypothetical protein